MDDIDAYLDRSGRPVRGRPRELLRIPSVSADTERHADVRRAADWVAGQFRRLGLTTELIETSGQPLVYAESPPVPGQPTVLVYGHYDVQPVEPLDEWISPPFEPTKRSGNLYARGATDDKGQMLTHLLSTPGLAEDPRQAAGAAQVPDRGRGRSRQQGDLIDYLATPAAQAEAEVRHRA